MSHRVAISNSRITAVSHGRIGFGYKDSRTQSWKTTRLPVQEFMRRFLQHVLPKGFNKVRYYGLLSPTNRTRLKRIQLLLSEPEALPGQEEDLRQEAYPFRESARPCPQCGEGWLVVIGRLPRLPRAPP